MKEKIVLIGAGSAIFTQGLVRDLAVRAKPAVLALVDVDPQALETADRLAGKIVDALSAPITVEASLDRRDVLAGATTVITTIAVGGRRAWEADVFVPRRFGVYQPVGDTAMPGGTSRALRMIPVMLDIARDMLDLAPEALFVNYANPMTAICQAVRKHTGVRVVGLCNGVADRQRTIARLLGKKPSGLSFSYVGINHLTWLREVRDNGASEKPRLKEIAATRLALLRRGTPIGQHFEEAGTAGQAEALELSDIMPATWAMFELFDAIPLPFDRHIVEFFPWLFCGPAQYYGATLGVDAYSFENTIRQGDIIYAEMQENAFSPHPLPKQYLERHIGEHENLVEVLNAIEDDSGLLISANLPNDGLIPDLPARSYLEAPALVDARGVRHAEVEPLPPALLGTLSTRLQWVETVIEAAVEGSRTKFAQALILDGAVRRVEAARHMADELLAAQMEHLPQFAGTIREGYVAHAASTESQEGGGQNVRSAPVEGNPLR